MNGRWTLLRPVWTVLSGLALLGSPLDAAPGSESGAARPQLDAAAAARHRAHGPGEILGFQLCF